MKKHKFLILFVFVYVLFAFLTYKTWPIANGEEFRYLRGKETLEHLLKGEFTELLIQPKPHYFLYNGYVAVLNLLNTNFYYEWFHLMNLLFSTLIFVAVYFLGYEYFKKSTWAMLPVLTLVLFPTFFGHMAINPIDMPFTVFYLFSLLAIYRYSGKKKLSGGQILTLGTLFGISQALRQLGLTLYVLLVLMDIVDSKNTFNVIKNRISGYVLVFIVANFLMVITWPNFAINYFKSLWWYLFIGSNFYLWDYGLLFMGKILTNPQRPAYYLPLLQIITTPLFLIGLFLTTSKFWNKLIKNKLSLLLIYALGINYLLYFLLKPVLYDGTRHFLHLIPIFTLLAIFNLQLLLNSKMKRYYKKLIVGVIVINLSWLGYKTITTFPNHYVYFNVLSKAFGNPYHQFESDYSNLLYKESSEWIRNEYVDQFDYKIKVYVCDNGYAVDYYSQKKFAVVIDREMADIIICDFRELSRNIGNPGYSGEILYEVGIDETPINFVIQK